ncbi:MAG: hypothetical protein ACKVXR_02525 [Planctomycetota bacterium]
MVFLARSCLPLALTLLAAQEPPAPPAPPPEAEPEPEVDATTVLGTLTWPEERARDARISFSLRSAVEASAAIDHPEGTALYRSGAWITLGTAGSPADHAEVSRQARIGEGLQRRAAILALGEFQGKETNFLLGLVDDRDLLVAECAMLSLLRSKDPRGRDRVVALAASGSADARAVLAAKLLEYDQSPQTATPPRAVRTLLRLRFEAARAFGMLDGANFTASRIEELSADPEFVSAVVLRASVHLAKGAVHDHLLSALLDGKGPGRLAAAADAIPRQLSQLVENELWAPRDAGEWSFLLSEIERQRVEIMAPGLLRAAEVVPGLRWKARAVGSRSQRVDLEAFAQVGISELAAPDRIEVCQAIGASEEAAARDLLAVLDQDPDPRVRSAALVARLRLGDRSAASSVEKILFDRTEPQHASVLEFLCRNAREASISVRLEEFLRLASRADLATVAAALTAQTQSTGRATARSLLAEDAPPVGEYRYQVVRALSRRPTPQDLEALTSLFPQPGERELNVELACSLAVLSSPVVRPVLRAALWRGSFDESVLAGFLLADGTGGVRTLIEEIRRPPPGARAADLRRIGFALGEWGGVEALSELARETGSAAGPEMQGALLGALGSRTQ